MFKNCHIFAFFLFGYLIGFSCAVEKPSFITYCSDSTSTETVDDCSSDFSSHNDIRSSVVCTDESPQYRVCRISNLMIDMSKVFLREPMNDYKPAFMHPDAFLVGCSDLTGSVHPKIPSPLITSGFGGDPNHFGSFQLSPFLGSQNSNQFEKCTEWVSRTTLIATRDWYRNVWHRFVNDGWSFFFQLEKLDLLDKETEIDTLLFDYMEMAGEYPSIIRSFSRNVTQIAPGDTSILCFKDAVFNLGRHWRTHFPEGRHEVTSSQIAQWQPALQRFSNYMKRKFEVSESPRESLLRAYWVTRAPRDVRQIVNEDQIVAQLHKDFRNVIDIQKIEFTHLSLKEQMQIAANCDLLLGMHGAGLTHILWMPPKSAIVEFLPLKYYDTLYGNVAKLMGHFHIRYQNIHPHNHFPLASMPPGWDKLANTVLIYEEIKPLVEQAIDYLRN